MQEWNLLSTEEQQDYDIAVKALTLRLDQDSLMAAVQDFCHACQQDNEMVTDYIRRLEQCYQLAYGKDKLSSETKEAILFGQLQAGLIYQIVKSPAVSSSQSYSVLCTAAKAEEKRIAELRHRQLYQQFGKQPQHRRVSEQKMSPPQNMRSPNTIPRKCYVCVVVHSI